MGGADADAVGAGRYEAVIVDVEVDGGGMSSGWLAGPLLGVATHTDRCASVQAAVGSLLVVVGDEDVELVLEVADGLRPVLGGR